LRRVLDCCLGVGRSFRLFIVQSLSPAFVDHDGSVMFKESDIENARFVNEGMEVGNRGEEEG
jgi:hypothetical protein